MRKDVRERLVLPVALPVGILVGLAAVLFGFSRILLSLSHTAATATALVVAFSIVVISAVAASRKVVRASSLASMAGAIVGVAMLAGGIALIGVSPQKAEGGGGGGGPAVNVVAEGLKFDTAEIDLPANTPSTIHFENKDAGVQHNIAIFQDDTLKTLLFRGDLVTGPGSADYQVPALPPGTYYFHCDVHPTMNGKVVVGASSSPTPATTSGSGGGATASPSTVTAEGIRFDTDHIDLPANTPVSLTFRNNDAGTPHNIAIYTDSSLSKALFKGQIVTGPATVTYQIPALPPGTYYFHCDVHPTMNGSVTVG